jgi:hypothetical protein
MHIYCKIKFICNFLEKLETLNKYHPVLSRQIL